VSASVLTLEFLFNSVHPERVEGFGIQALL